MNYNNQGGHHPIYQQHQQQQQQNDWHYMNYQLHQQPQHHFNMTEPLQEPVAFEDFQFSLGLDPEFAMPVPLDIPPPMTTTTSIPNDFFASLNTNNPIMNHAVLDEQDHKAFSQFLDQFFVDPNMQIDTVQEEKQHTILNSLDEHKRYYKNDDLIYLQQSSQITPPYIKTKSSVSPPPVNIKKEEQQSPTSGGAIRRCSNNKPHKELLTEEEKRSNHIASEQKRRSMIRSGFKDLTEIVPTLKNINNSKSTVLFKAVDYIRYLEKRNRGLREKIKNLEVRVEVEGRINIFSTVPNTSALLQHKTQQRQLLELQEKLQLHQKMLKQQQQQGNKTTISA